MNQHKAIIFDWDGTLADSTKQILSATLFALKKLNKPIPPIEHIKKTIGLPHTEACDILFSDVTPELLEEFIKYYRRDYFKADNPAVLFPDVKELLPNLAQKTLLAIATGKSRVGLDKGLEDTGVKSLFATTRTVNECHSKPNPDMILSICDELGIYPNEIIMVGDTIMDLLTAQNAHSDAVGLTTGAHSIELLQTVPSKAIFLNFLEFYDWISDKII
ncbi:HAD-IA family hydrolase [Neisseriaceae bacterium PsAf]|nr:HAD-IA family hydrolase [Neisseriaceae bacterium PsAf]MCV2503689.1 HAD-IA family hydrolase [Neisseriaceae bacterium]